MMLSFSLMAQKETTINNPRYDERRLLTYGFSIGIHTASMQLSYSDYFTTPLMDSLHSIMTLKKPGFSLGFIINFKLSPSFNSRFTPKVSFSEYILRYNFITQTPTNEIIESVSVDFPFLIKYHSQRRENMRMYILGGFTGSIEAGKRKKIEKDRDLLQLKGVNLMVDFGFGFDLYYPLFKFSPEIRFALGLVDVMGSTNDLTAGIDKLKTKSISLYFHFQ